MEKQAFTLLMKMLEDQKSDNDSQFSEINDKLEKVLEFKYKLIGGSIVISIIGSSILNYLIKTGGH